MKNTLLFKLARIFLPSYFFLYSEAVFADNWVISNDQFKQLIAQFHIPSAAVVVIHHGKIQSSLYHQSNHSSIFEAASLSKPIFAYGVMKLVERGQFNLDEPLSHYLPFSDDDQLNLQLKSVTARMILEHSSGLPNWRKDNKKITLLNRPGEKFSYSGEGYFYLQKVIEKITKQPLDQYIKDNVFNPLNMHHSSYIWRDDYKNTMVIGHADNGKPLSIDKYTSPNAAYTIYTTAEDYAHFIQAIMLHQGLSKKLFEKMLTPQIKASENAPIFWGLGFGLIKTQNGMAFWHWGDNRGYKNFFIIFPNNNAIIIFTNSDNGLPFIFDVLQKMTGQQLPIYKWIKSLYLNL